MSPRTRDAISRVVLTILALNAVGLIALLGQWLLAGGGSDGVGRYLQEVAGNVGSTAKIIRYLVYLSVYALTLEWLLRRVVQYQFYRRPVRWLPALGVAATALIYAATHAVYHLSGVIYALILGLGTAVWYHYRRDWREIALWHVQWEVLAVAGAIFLCVFDIGQAPQHFLFVYKRDQVRQQIMTYAPGWGWLDRHHRDDELFTEISDWLRSGTSDRQPLHFDRALLTEWGTGLRLQRTFQTLAPLTAMDTEIWAIAAGMQLDYECANETAQANAWYCPLTRLAAWQPDDMLSGFFCCARRHPGYGYTYPPVTVITDTAALEITWQEQGLSWVGRKAGLNELPDMVPPAYHGMLNEINSARSTWRSW